MGVTKSLIGSIVGAAVALGVYYGIKQSTGETYVWFPLIIGLVVGVGARIASGSSLSAGSRVVAGAIAAIVAGLAMFGPDVVEGMTGNAEFGPIETTERLVNDTVPKVNDDETGETSEDSTSSDDAADSDQDAADSDGDEAAATDEGDADETTTQEDSSSDDEGSEDSADDGDGDGDDEAANTETGDSEAPTNIDVNQAFAERGKPDKAVPESPETIKKFEELIKKQKHESWLATFLPIICSGIGMVLAYIVGQSGSAPTPPKS